MKIKFKMLFKKMFVEALKHSWNYRPLYCFLIMTLWVFILVTAMYKYTSIERKGAVMKPWILPKQLEVSAQELEELEWEEAVEPALLLRWEERKLGARQQAAPKWVHLKIQHQTKIRKIHTEYQNLVDKICRPPETITNGTEGVVDEGTWLLQGVVVVTRHGDRGPLTHLKSGSDIPCDVKPTSELLKRYEEYLHNVSGGALRGPWAAAPGPFHNYPSLPGRELTRCPIAQMTSLGVLQMLTVGSILKEAYSKKLNLFNDTPTKKGDVIIWSTQYRRTYQSMLAVLWGFGGSQAMAEAARVRESQAVTYCFQDCACPAISHLNGQVNSMAHRRLKLHTQLKKALKQISDNIFEKQESSTPDVIIDAVLAYMCHDVPLPCNVTENTDAILPKRKLQSFISDKIRLKSAFKSLNSDIDYERSNLDLNNEFGRKAKNIIIMKYVKKKQDPIQKKFEDFDTQMEKQKLLYHQQIYYDDLSGDSGREPQDELSKQKSKKNKNFCLKKDTVVDLFTYSSHKGKNIFRKQRGLLQAYGLFQNIVQNMIRMISENKPKFVLYSGHDKTIEPLIYALGLRKNSDLIGYASRLIFEVYRKKNLMDEFMYNKRKAVAQDFYFRVIYNGLDVTGDLSFCNATTNIEVKTYTYTTIALLCPIENIVRFLHDDYFTLFNVSNYKDACWSFKRGQYNVVKNIRYES